MALAIAYGVRADRMLPNRLLVSAYVARHLRLWALLRVGLSGMFFLAGTDPLRVPPLTVGAIVALCAVVNVVELHVRHERALLGNLGVDPFVVSMLVTLPSLAGELLLRTIGAPRG